MQLTNEQVIDLFRQGEVDVDGVTLFLSEQGDFEQDGKYQTAEVIFTDGVKYYRTDVTRSGSPFTDWYYEDYGDADIDEVEKREVTITKWVSI